MPKTLLLIADWLRQANVSDLRLLKTNQFGWKVQKAYAVHWRAPFMQNVLACGAGARRARERALCPRLNVFFFGDRCVP